VDLDLNGTAGNDSGTIANANTMYQSDPDAAVSETANVPGLSSKREIGLTTDSPSISDRLTDGDADFLAGLVGDTVGGNVAWAFQWDFVLGNDESFIISKDKHLQIPAPGAALLAMLGVSLVGAIRRRRSA
jgi:hypothetical protein